MSTDVMSQQDGYDALELRAPKERGGAPSFAVNAQLADTHKKVAEDLGWPQ